MTRDSSLVTDDRLEDLWASLWRLPKRLSVSEFAEKYIVLDSDLSARTGDYKVSVTPHMREVMDAVSDPLVREVTFAGGTQIGKTQSLLLNVLCWAGRMAPGNGLFIGPTKEYAADFVRTRLRPQLRKLKPDEAEERGSGGAGEEDEVVEGDEGTALYIKMARMNLWAVGTERPEGLKSKPIKFVLGTELEDWKDGALELAQKRLTTFLDYKLICDGNPGLESGIMWQRFLAGDRCLRHEMCPHCGRYQELQLDGFTWGEGKHVKGLDVDEETIKGTVAYVCQRCAAEIRPEHRWTMQAGGVWVPEGCEAADGTGELTGKRTGPGWPTHRSFSMGWASSPFVDWWQTVAEFVKQKKRPGGLSPTFQNSAAGKPYTPKGEVLKTDIVKRKFTPLGKGGYVADVVPAECRCLVGGIDVQHDGFWVLVEGYGFRARKSWVLDAAWVAAPKNEPGATMAALRRILATRYPLEKGHSGLELYGDKGMPVSQYFIDTGDGPRTPEMYRLVRDLGRGDYGAWLEAAKGVDTLGVSPYGESVAERDVAVEAGSDRTEKAPLKLTRVSNWYWKEEISGYLLRKEDERSAGLAAAELTHMLLPAWDDEASWMARYVEHVCNEQRLPIRKKNSRRVELRWLPRYEGAPNHLLDCHVLARCCAKALGVERRCWGFYGECAVGAGCEKCR